MRSKIRCIFFFYCVENKEGKEKSMISDRKLLPIILQDMA